MRPVLKRQAHPDAAARACLDADHFWWAGIATVLPRGSLLPRRGPFLLRRWNELRLEHGPRPVFRYPSAAPHEARVRARPTTTGLGDVLCAWMMPMALSRLWGKGVRIPVPFAAGGTQHEPSRPRLTAARLEQSFDFPSFTSLVPVEAAPDGEPWVCAVSQQWHLDSCMETSYDTIPSWVRGGVDRHEYYAAYREVARNLVAGVAPAFADGRPYWALHARRGDRGAPHAGEDTLAEAVASRSGDWVVVSDDPATAAALRHGLAARGCTVADVPAAEDAYDRAVSDLRLLVGARVVVSSVRGGWSAFPYAATRISGSPLVITEPLAQSLPWRIIRAHSPIPIAGVFHGLAAFEG